MTSCPAPGCIVIRLNGRAGPGGTKGRASVPAMKVSPSGLWAHARSDEGRKQLRYLGVSVFFVPVGQIVGTMIQFAGDGRDVAGPLTMTQTRPRSAVEGFARSADRRVDVFLVRLGDAQE